MYSISVFGDSITFGRGNNINRGWVGRLRKVFEQKDPYNAVYNLGVPGDTSKDLVKRFDVEASSRIKYLREGDRHVIILAIGLNDSRLNKGKVETSLKDFEKNVNSLIKKAKKHTKEILIIGLTPVDEILTKDYEDTSFSNERIQKYNDLLREISFKQGIPFLDIFSELSLINYEILLKDGLHPNSEGYKEIFELVKIFLEENKIL